VKANLFFIGGIAARLTGSERLAAMGGLYAHAPWLAVLFAIPALSLAGIPPLSGFWAKFVLVEASLDARAWVAAGVALLTGLFTLLSMSKIWNEAFLKPHPAGEGSGSAGSGSGGGLRSADGLRPALWAVGALAAMTVAIGLAAGPVMDYAVAAAQQLAAPAAYIDAVVRAGGN